MTAAEKSRVGVQGGLRLVEIEGVDLNACGGTHLKSLSEIQVLLRSPETPLIDCVVGNQMQSCSTMRGALADAVS